MKPKDRSMKGRNPRPGLKAKELPPRDFFGREIPVIDVLESQDLGTLNRAQRRQLAKLIAQRESKARKTQRGRDGR